MFRHAEADFLITGAGARLAEGCNEAAPLPVAARREPGGVTARRRFGFAYEQTGFISPHRVKFPAHPLAAGGNLCRGVTASGNDQRQDGRRDRSPPGGHIGRVIDSSGVRRPSAPGEREALEPPTRNGETR
jgi:hypothetical protein